MPSRRRFLRGVGGAVSLGALAASGGCLSILNPLSRSAADSVRRVDASSALSRSAFADYAETMAARYGDGGVWGLGSAPESPAFVGAWTGRLTPGGSRSRGGGDLVVGDFAIACYALGRRGEATENHYRYWLWAAGEPAAEATVEGPTGPVAVTPKLRGLGLSVAFGSPEQLQRYAPGGDRTRSGVVDVRLGGPDGNSSAGGFRLRDGEVGPSPPRTWDTDGSIGQDTDDYVVGWQGARAGTQSVNAVCATTRPADAPGGVVPFEWGTHVAGGGYR